MLTYKYSTFSLRIWELLWCCIICVVGCAGNITVLIVLSKSKRISRKSPFNVYLFTLAVVDLLASLYVIPDYVLRTDIYDPPGGHTGDLLCKFLIGGFIPFWLLGVSVYLLVVICIERRKAILDPFSTLQLPRLSKVVLIILFLFLLGMFNQIPTWYSIYYNKVNSTSGNFCAYKEDYNTAMAFHFASFVLQCAIPMLIFVTSFYQIRKQLEKTRDEIKASLSAYTQAGVHDKTCSALKKRQATIATMQIVVLVFFICILPNEIVYMIFQFVSNPELEMNSPLFQVTVLLRYTNSCLNPILYSYRSTEFRKHFVEVFKSVKVFKTPRVRPKASSTTTGYSLLV